MRTRILTALAACLAAIGLSIGGAASVGTADEAPALGSLVSATAIAQDPYGAVQWEVISTAPPVSIDVVGWGPARDICGTASTFACTTDEVFIYGGECITIHLVWAVQTDTQNAADELYGACTPEATFPEPPVEESAPPVVEPEPAPAVIEEPAPVVVPEPEPAPTPKTPGCG